MGLVYSKADAEGSGPPPMPSFANIGAAAAEVLKKEKVCYFATTHKPTVCMLPQARHQGMECT